MIKTPTTREVGSIGQDVAINYLLHAGLTNPGLVAGDDYLIGRLQYSIGDLIAWHPRRGMMTFEVKTEVKHTGNLFIETVSDESFSFGGWIHYSEAQRLIYVFLDNRQIYDVDLRLLKSWWITSGCHKYREVKQEKNRQSHVTRGCPVPIEHIGSEIGYNVASFDDGLMVSGLRKVKPRPLHEDELAFSN